MNTLTPSRSRLQQRGFTMIEMIGVLAIIAILAVIVVPKVFSTIAGSRVTSAVASINAMRTAVTEYAGRFGTVPLTTSSANARIDDLLIASQMLENRFVVKIGTQPGAALSAGAVWNNTTSAWTGGQTQATQSRIICSLATPATVPSAALGANFRLNGGNTNLPAGSRVVAAVLMRITGTEALDLSQRIDGTALSQTNATTPDNNGKVVYALPDAQGLTDAYVYLAHQ